MNTVKLDGDLEKVGDEAKVLIKGVYMGDAKFMKDGTLVLTTTDMFGNELKVDYDDLKEFTDDMQTLVFD